MNPVPVIVTRTPPPAGASGRDSAVTVGLAVAAVAGWTSMGAKAGSAHASKPAQRRIDGMSNEILPLSRGRLTPEMI